MTEQWYTAPIGMDDAAQALGVSRRTLTDTIKELPFYELRGNKKVFYPEHIARLRREMHECACKPNGIMDGLMHTAPDRMDAGSGALSRLKTLAAQKKYAHR